MDRQDSLRPAENSRLDTLEDRVNRLEFQHSSTNEQGCSTALRAEADVQELGVFYNSLEDEVDKINRAAGERMMSIDGRIDSVSEQLRVLQAAGTNTSDISPGANNDGDRAPGESTDFMVLMEQIALQQKSIVSLTERIQELEAAGSSTDISDSRSPHQLVQVLVQQLNDGDVLSAPDIAALHNVLRQEGVVEIAARPVAAAQISLQSPPLTAPNTRQSSTMVERLQPQLQPQSKKRGPPSNSSKGSTSEEQPLAKATKRDRSQLSRPSVDGTTRESAPPSRATKQSSRGRGRRLQSRGQSSRRYSDLSARSNGSAQSQVSSVFDDTQGTTTPLVPDYARRYTPPIPLMQSTVPVAAQENVHSDVVGALVVSNGNAPLAVGNESRKTPGMVDANQTMIDGDPHESSDPTIPAERRSERTHKPTKLFGDQIHWKQANRRMKGQFRPSPVKTQPQGRFANL